MSYKTFKQRISAAVFRRDWARRLWLQVQCWKAAVPGGARRRWSEAGEDEVLLKLAAPWLDTGFYVDVGANLPTKRSNTYRLYLHGMRGICVEPNLELAALYERTRPRDEVVCAAVGRDAGVALLQRFNYHVYSTCSEDEGRRRVEKASARMRTELLRTSLVARVTLRDLLAEKRTRLGGLFFLLKTDTEGLDLEVLQSNDWERDRPRYVLSESAGRRSEVREFLEQQNYRLLEEFPSNQLFECLDADK